MTLQDTKMNTMVKDVLSSLGWNDGFIPIANENNLKLLSLIKDSTETSTHKQSILQVRQQEVDRVVNLLSNSENEFGHNLKLISALKSQLSTEYHFKKLAEHEHSRLVQEISSVEKSINDLFQQQTSTKNEIAKLNANMDKLSECIQWSKSALTEWRQVMNRGEDANRLIQNFCKMDTGKAEVSNINF